MGMRRLRLTAASLLVSVLFAASLDAATTSRRASPTQRPPATRGARESRSGRRNTPPGERGRSPGGPAQRPHTHPETTDPEVAKAINAFSAGDYVKARAIAEGIMQKPDRGSRRAEALDVMVESWLLQGEFGKARAAARKYGKEAPKASGEALVRIDAEEKEYHADLKRLEARKRKAKKAEDQAHFQLLIGHTHHKVGRMAEAEKAYREVIARYPKTKAAGMARRQLASMQESEEKPKK